MVVLPQTSAARITLAIALSLLAHVIVLFAPLIKLPPSEKLLPPLTARLEPLPKIATAPAPVRKSTPVKKSKPKPQPSPPVPEKAPPGNKPTKNVQTEEPQIDPEPQLALAVPKTAPPNDKSTKDGPTKEPQIDPDPQPPAIDEAVNKPIDEVQPAHPLPKHAQLTFIAYKGTDFEIGKARHYLEISDDKSYIIRVGMNTTGLASIFKAFESNQQSSGALTAQGLRPNEFSEIKNTSKGKEALEAKFAWGEKLLSFSNGNSTPLPEQAQDIISFLYQLSQLPLDQGAVPLYISNGKKLERYELAVGEEENIQTRLGRLRALPLRKVHAPGEEGLVIWLGLEYRLLPVKIRQIDRDGQIAGEMVVSEILVADE